MPSFDEVADFIREQTGYSHVMPGTRLVEDAGMDGDDMFLLMEAYSERFRVDLATYRWYFHHGEEGWSIGGLFFAPPYRRVPHLPMTAGMLHEFAQQKRWGLQYPEHQLPNRRIDTLINQIFALATFCLLGYSLWRHFSP